jgi:cysteinyl-tRNA synthetase
MRKEGRDMIVQNGIDVTDRVMAEAKRKQEIGRRIYQRDYYPTVIAHLKSAKQVLEIIPRPWVDDCISEMRSAIDDMIKKMEG